ncbi:alanine/glycine:cation symporter family protein [Haliangium ochraceum]|uniref:Amino acid carrier protein n=1 Tax=Haliangium ochraceum (strain DSM 14365 / JCM 11303 / SMP-2) TaxID=502025 RepID=D0LKS7_HALO1|nr:sodium:alanine symporter family protein [Haliangium ochraceum]ACY16647.1 amino acid carrier protein [Haliangium ochraceum DSM 14365]
MDTITSGFETIVGYLNTFVWGLPADLPWIVVALLGTGLIVTGWLAFIQLRRVGHAIAVVAGRYDDPDDPGDVTHFQALSTALSATVGIGNIAGVATAVHYGGPGAIFWMWVTALFGMALKFTECTLSVHYRGFDEKGEVAGGPMYYIEHGLGKSWKPMAVFFAFCAMIASFGGGNMNQANTVAVSARAEFLIPAWLTGIVLVVAVGAVIIGGIKSIARVTSRLAPSMALLYVSAALIILVLNIGEIPGAFGTILTGAFNPEAGLGGTAAGGFMVTLLWGVKRGLFSNEAGQGSAPIAHAAAQTDEPVREGLVGMLEPLIDTLIICTMTALVIVITGVWDDKKDTRLPLSRAEVHLVDAAAADAGPVSVSVAEGTQAALVFHEADGVVDDARLVVLDDSGAATPYSGTLSFDPVAGTFDSAETLYLEGKMLQNSSALTAWAFERGLEPLGDWGGLVVIVCVFLFAVSTMISWSYYGDRCVTYLFGSRYVIVYRLVFLVFVYLGSVFALETVWAFGDVALGLMTAPNLIAILLLLPKVAELTRDYFQRMREERGN